MSVLYDVAEHGPVHWPMPFPGVWRRDPKKPDRLVYWQLADGTLHETSYQKDEPAEALQPFEVERNREGVWLDVAEPAGQQRLFAIERDGSMTGLDHYRTRS